ncbi:hypothetical protein ACP4OV_020482 [Aristida adscensionis]
MDLVVEVPHKRQCKVIHLRDNSDFGVSESDDDDDNAFVLDSEGDLDSRMDCDLDNSSDSSKIQAGLYNLYMKQRKEMKTLKSKLQKSMKHKDKKIRAEVIEKDAFTRFSWQSSVPCVKFFGNKLIDQELLSDEDVLVCFILVALNCFLYPNTSIIPSCKYLGIFEDVSNLRKFDWAQSILDCLLQGVRIYNLGKNRLNQDCGALSGCLFLIAVYYLDFVDFGHRHVDSGLPRISVWKKSMIKDYSELDQLSPGTYGYRPVMDISRTCYSKQSVFHYTNPAPLSMNLEFLAALDSNCGCNLRDRLKILICKLLEEHSMKSAFNMEITSLASLFDDLKKTFATLLEHAYSVDSHTQKMVVTMLKLIADFVNDDNSENCECSNRNSASVLHDKPLHSQTAFNSKSKFSHSPAAPSGSNKIGSHSSCPKTASPSIVCVNEQNPISHSCDIANDLQKSPNKDGSCSILSKNKYKSRMINDYTTESDINRLRDPFGDFEDEFDERDIKLKKSVSFTRNPSDRDIIQLGKASDDMDGCDSPPSDEYADRFKFSRSPILLQSPEDSPVCNERVTPNLSQPRNSHLRYSNLHPSKRPECVVPGEKSIFQKSNELSKRCDEIYNGNLLSSQQVAAKSVHKIGKSSDLSRHDIVAADNMDNNDDCSDHPDSTGGKLPRYGPRRTIHPVIRYHEFRNETRTRFRMTDSKKKNYRAICKLANSKYKDLDAHPEQSKKHYFFGNVGDNLLKDPTEVSQFVLETAFTRSQKARPLTSSNLPFFPICFEKHWFLFVVDIKDRYFLFLDSYYTKDSDYQKHVRERLIHSFKHHWNLYVQGSHKVDFEDYQIIYPSVPHQGLENRADGGICIMMCMQHWNSPRTNLCNIFGRFDIPRIRVKIANELMFLPQNTGYKRHVLETAENDSDAE